MQFKNSTGRQISGTFIRMIRKLPKYYQIKKPIDFMAIKCVVEGEACSHVYQLCVCVCACAHASTTVHAKIKCALTLSSTGPFCADVLVIPLPFFPPFSSSPLLTVPSLPLSPFPMTPLFLPLFTLPFLPLILSILLWLQDIGW